MNVSNIEGDRGNEVMSGQEACGGVESLEAPNMPELSERIFESLGDPFTYSPLRNPFTLFGFLWGVPVPIFSLWFHGRATDGSVLELALSHPLQWFFMMHPVFFAFFFGVIGSIYVDHHQALKYRATHDELTGLLTHSVFHETGGELVEEHRERDSELGVIMLDLDNFKSINDSKGHQAGDRVLRTVAEVLREQTRDRDVLGRYGGEEFAVVLPNTSPGHASDVAERVRREVASRSGRIPSGLTLSAGVGSFPEDGKQLDEVIGVADRCLYLAKEDGRNRTVHSRTTGDEPE